ncbi:MAG: carbon-nitrogen hydrolase family protein [Acidobacteria bacterium]|nr:carbon-nitrogen hydrolase family protein [Acidobacteriota bacterium]
MQDLVRAAACPVPSQPGDVGGNLKLMAEFAAAANLVLFPELSLTGFLPNHPTGDHETWLRQALRFARSTAQRLDGPAVRGLTALARSSGALLCAGLLEDAGNVLYNTQVLAGPDGLLGYWRKMHIPMFEAPFYNGGGVPMVAETPLGRIGVNICFDALIPESTRLLAVRNVEIVLFPFAADPAIGFREWAGGALRARCQENGVFGVAANYVGRVEAAGIAQEFPGGSLMLDPRGRECGPELRRDELQSARAEPEYLYRFRRPELYGSLSGSFAAPSLPESSASLCPEGATGPGPPAASRPSGT